MVAGHVTEVRWGLIQSDSITFLATIPPAQSALQEHWGQNGMSVKLEIPESEFVNAVGLVAMRREVLRVTVEVLEPPQMHEGL